MKKKILIKETKVVGPDYFGTDSSITFLPSPKNGWFLRTKEDGDVPVDFKIAYPEKRRIQLRAGGTVLEIPEHILALKILLGLDRVILVPDQKWPPYIGGAGGYAKQIENSWVDSNVDFSTIEPFRNFVYNSSKNNHSVSIEIERSSELTVVVCSEWKPMPTKSLSLDEKALLDNDDRIKRILNARPQGFPYSTKNIAKILSFFGWPNIHHISWRNGNDEETSREWCEHAMQDTLGALALSHHQKIPRMKYFRFCAGHAEDLKCIKEVFTEKVS